MSENPEAASKNKSDGDQAATERLGQILDGFIDSAAEIKKSVEQPEAQESVSKTSEEDAKEEEVDTDDFRIVRPQGYSNPDVDESYKDVPDSSEDFDVNWNAEGMPSCKPQTGSRLHQIKLSYDIALPIVQGFVKRKLRKNGYYEKIKAEKAAIEKKKSKATEVSAKPTMNRDDASVLLMSYVLKRIMIRKRAQKVLSNEKIAAETATTVVESEKKVTLREQVAAAQSSSGRLTGSSSAKTARSTRKEQERRQENRKKASETREERERAARKDRKKGSSSVSIVRPSAPAVDLSTVTWSQICKLCVIKCCRFKIGR
jgi:hypothetical protein